METFEILTYTLGLIFLISGMDDLVIDFMHLLKGIKIKKFNNEQWNKIDHATEKTMVIMVPAWQEYDVIDAMVRTNIARIDYTNYQWFLGVYPNDEKTKLIALQLQREFPDQVNVVVADRPGPTSKAHCLNNVFEAVKQQSLLSKGKWMPDYLAIHDAEDVIHPDSLKVVNSMHHDFVQIPIFSLKAGLRELVPATYMDEFAENHLKELPTREAMGMPIPSAGVGTFFSMRSLLAIQQKYHFVFNEQSLTEDYELSMRIARMGFSQHFLTLRDRSGKDFVATRGYFPDRVRTSIRQKTRWITGITLQSGKLEKPSTLAQWYGHSRDQKGVATNLINLLGWISFASVLAYSGLNGSPIASFEFPEILNAMVMANLAIFCIRLVQRLRFTMKVYGLAHGIVAMPRVLLLNFINSFATVRAIYRYYRTPKNGSLRQMTWDKTDHRFPTPATIGEPNLAIHNTTKEVREAQL